MVNREELKAKQAEMQELTDEFWTTLRVSLRYDEWQDDESRAFALEIARIKIAQVQHFMQEAIGLCNVQLQGTQPLTQNDANP